MKDIHEEINDITDYLKSQKSYSRLKDIEEKMENDPHVIALSLAFQKTQRDYSDGLKHYEEDSIELNELQRKMFEAKYELDSLDLVKEYYNCLKEVNEPLRYLEYNLLSKFKFKETGCEKK